MSSPRVAQLSPSPGPCTLASTTELRTPVTGGRDWRVDVYVSGLALLPFRECEGPLNVSQVFHQTRGETKRSLGGRLFDSEAHDLVRCREPRSPYRNGFETRASAEQGSHSGFERVRLVLQWT